MYIVLEFQEEQDGTTRVLEPAIFEDKGDALQKYYLILQYAVKSELAKHTAVVMTPDGQTYKKECYTFTPEPEPEPEPQPEPIEEPVEPTEPAESEGE